MQADEREGGDITAADMVSPVTEPSQIQRYFEDTSVFITGATGFLGKLIMEKLLRSCPDLKKCYILIRAKKGKTPEERLEEIFDSVIFERLRRENSRAFEKVQMIFGDLVETGLGITDESKQLLLEEVNCIFHVAATVRFDEKIRIASYINIRATRDLLKLAKEMKNLKSLVHISTAYSHCPRKEIDEKFYEPSITPDKLLNVIESLDDDTLTAITPTLLGKWPNSYVYTKSIGEEIIKNEGTGLPIAMIRPSIVIATLKEPVAGWIDNLYGATGVLVGAALGLLRTLHCDPEKLADMVPADNVINCAIAASWEVGKTKSFNNNVEDKEDEKAVAIYNYVSSPEKPIRWKEWQRLAEKHAPAVPSSLQLWHYCFSLNANYFIHWLRLVFLQRIPAYIVDFLAYCVGKKPMLVKGYAKIEKFMAVISYFATRQWIFRNKNTQKLWKKLNVEDQKLFFFDMSRFNWDEYFYTYVRGGRVYLLKDPLDTIPQGRTKYVKLQIAHYTLLTVLALIFLKLVMLIINLIF